MSFPLTVAGGAGSEKYLLKTVRTDSDGAVAKAKLSLQKMARQMRRNIRSKNTVIWFHEFNESHVL